MVDRPSISQTQNGDLHVVFTVYSLEPEPTAGELYYTRSVDGGATWSVLWEYTEVDDALWTVEVDPNNRNRLFVGTGDYNFSDGRLYLSEDRGQTWQLVLDVDPASDLDDGLISHLAFDPTDPQTYNHSTSTFTHSPTGVCPVVLAEGGTGSSGR